MGLHLLSPAGNSHPSADSQTFDTVEHSCCCDFFFPPGLLAIPIFPCFFSDCIFGHRSLFLFAEVSTSSEIFGIVIFQGSDVGPLHTHSLVEAHSFQVFPYHLYDKDSQFFILIINLFFFFQMLAVTLPLDLDGLWMARMLL